MTSSDMRPVGLLICALGGEGGGVLVEWLVDTANRCGYAAQSTSIPGVAQRTGSTTYYFEVFPVPLTELNGRKPVFSLYPVPGALDVLVSSELLETVRHVGNGMAAPGRTLTISSNARTLTTAEKVQLADGRASSEALLDIVRLQSRKACIFDMSSVARESETVVSAVLFGAIAGSGALPFAREEFERAVRQSGRGAEASLRGFSRAFDIVSGGRPAKDAVIATAAIATPAATFPDFPPQAQATLALGHARMIEYQDKAYAALYLRRLKRVFAADKQADAEGKGEFAITRETARYLALWMAFDDVVRVADLKSRASRFVRVRAEVKARDDELVRIYDHFKPGVPEFAGLLPARWARALVAWDRRRQGNGHRPFALALKVPVHALSGFLMLRVMAKLKWLRRRGSRYAHEQSMIERWLAAIEAGARDGWELGHEIALCGRLIKGYGATNDRGRDNLLHILDHVAVGGKFADPHARAEAVRAARVAALADDAGRELDKTLASQGVAPRPVKAQPILWVRKPRDTAAVR
ncbi:MAG TPA: indolepyruvate oxidoreductase subunit beta family protein [Burkholderiales bacterium]|nr:indolepyruvate oxidoreductase subunit beta family protein [Burkholderiales bacterium]